jgi:catalase
VLPNDSKSSSKKSASSRTNTGTLIRLAAIGAIMAGVAGGFAYTAGWFSPHRLTQARIIDTFQTINGVHSGFRRNHSKGVCIAGYFNGNGQGETLSDAAVFAPGRVPVIGRFSLAGGQPYVPDSPKAVLAMALSFQPAGGEEWRMGMIDLPVFPVSTVQGFYAQLVASAPDPKTGKPVPANMAAFLASHPETMRALQLIRANPVASGFADATFNGLNAFEFVNAQGVSTPVRWSMVPTAPFVPASAAQTATNDHNYLFDDLIARLHQGPLQWHLVVTEAQPGDLTNNATIPWPASRAHVDTGTLTIDQILDEADGPCRTINFDPLVLPSGIAPSDDPLLSARSAAYSQSFRRRAGEKAEPSAVTIPASASPSVSKGV